MSAAEISYFHNHAREICLANLEDPEDAGKAATEFFKRHDKNIDAMRDSQNPDGGITTAFFGRMVTADYAEGGQAAVFVSHALTTHEEESERDFFVGIDDLTGVAGHISDNSELNSGIFYGYVVIDLPQLFRNTRGWTENPIEQCGVGVEYLAHLIAAESMGAKHGSTAPFAYASLVLAEVGSRQPRSLAEAFQRAVPPDTGATTEALLRYLQDVDDNYGKHEDRRLMVFESMLETESSHTLPKNLESLNIARSTMPELGGWLREQVLAHAGG